MGRILVSSRRLTIGGPGCPFVMKNRTSELLQGTLELLILRTLGNGPMHGWGISQKILLLSEDTFLIKEGSLYPALHRLERKNWIKAEWGVSENNRKAKYYRLTVTGEKQLGVEQQEWQRFVKAMTLILQQNEIS